MATLSFPAPRDDWQELWPRETLDERLRSHARGRGSHLAVVDPTADVTLTFGELDALTSALAGSMKTLGIERGDVVAAQLPNSWQFVVASCAATRIGAVFLPLSTAYRRAELSHMLGASGAKMLIVPRERSGHNYELLARDLAPALPSLTSIAIVDGVGSEASSSVRLLPFEELLHSETEIEPEPHDFGDPTVLLFTSGTEATPKGIVHTHGTANYSLGICSELWGLAPSDVVLVAAPMGHGAGFQWCHRIALHQGLTQVVIDRWDPDDAAKVIRESGCTFTYAPTRFLLDLVTLAASGVDVHMRLFASGGAPIPGVLVEDAKRLMGCQVFATYGQTECFVATSTSARDSKDKITGSDGKAIPGAQVLIVDTDGLPVESGEIGECITRGPHVAGGYLEGTAPAQQSFRSDGWLWTGDRCTMDADGYVRVLGRTREMIIRNGLNISPAEVEGYVLEMDEVKAVAVVGRSDPQVGERTCAFVVVQSDEAVTLEDVQRHFGNRDVAKYKWPEYVITVPELPYSAVGKIQRQRLKEHAESLGD